jgi:hypothetical protein
MAFRPAITALALFILATLLFASFVGLVEALILMGGFALLGLLLREMENARHERK